MIRVEDLRNSEYDPATVVPRGGMDVEEAAAMIRPLLEDVRGRGVDAVLEASEKFDGIRPRQLRVAAKALYTALEALEPAVRAALEAAVERVQLVHGAQRRPDVRTELEDGAVVTTRWLPVDRVGLYVPGGGAVYPSSVIMNVVPALEAGVSSIAIASPPQKDHDGLPHPVILATAALLGIEEVYAAGGAQAIAMFGYGVSDESGVVCRKVDMVTGPGNIWVTAAKRELRGTIGTDSEAGPTEVLILADETANPAWVAADLISQAEHDPMAAAVVVTTSTSLASEVLEHVAKQWAETRHKERVREALAGQQSAILIVDDEAKALELVNAYAAEHLEIHLADAERVAAEVRSAGAIFVGAHSPVSLGDYCAGSNHVLPTTAGAAHTGGLSVQTFLRCVYVVNYQAAALQAIGPSVMALAEAEDLRAHREAVRLRLSDAG